MNPSSEIRESGTENGMWEIKTKNGWRRITVPEIDEALKHAYANDVEWKAHINQQIDLETFRKMKGHNVDDVSALEALKKNAGRRPEKQSHECYCKRIFG